MADYKRLVSYIYNYENGIKRNNVGYARVEARNGQCKCTINISAPSLNDRQLKAYMFKRGKDGLIGILLGTLQIRNGMCEYKVLTNSQNVMNSGISLDEIGGIIVYLNDKKYYGTEWDDMPLDMDVVSTIENDRNLPQAPEGKMEEKPLERREEKYEKEREERPLERREEKYEKEREERPLERREEKYEKEREERPLERREEKYEKEREERPVEKREEKYKEEREERPVEKREEKHEPMYEERPEEKRESKPEMEDDLLGSRNPERDRWEDLNTEKYFGKRLEPEVTEPKAPGPKVMEPKAMEPKAMEPKVTEPMSNKQNKEIPGAKKEEETKTSINDSNNSNVQGTHIDECEEYKKGFHYTNGCNLAEGYPKTEYDEHPIAKRLYMEYPRMFPFDDNEIAWCVKIEPQDIGLLPMDTWVLGNNSFLLHGYYSYRHLIFARVNDMSGYYYIIGVPGTFHNREKFMAKMFGFENFKCVKRPDRRTGEFGYWYVPITLK